MHLQRAQEWSRHSRLLRDLVKIGHSTSKSLPISRPITPVGEAIPNDAALDLIPMKQILVKALELGNPELGAEAWARCRSMGSVPKDGLL
jgi:hypothetical protein